MRLQGSSIDTDTAIKKIRRTIRKFDGDDWATMLTTISNTLVEAGFPYIEPLYAADHEDAQLFLIYLTLAGKDWYPEDIAAIEKILDADEDSLDHPDQR